MKILDRYRIIELTADLLRPGDEFAGRVVASIRRRRLGWLVFVTFTDGSHTTYDKNTLFEVKRR